MEIFENLCDGGCQAKLGPEFLESVLKTLPKFEYPENYLEDSLLVGFESNDDAAVFKISEEVAVVSTLDFFTPMVDDPYLFGKITAANALSDVYAMGGCVKFALNIVCFPEHLDKNILGEILRGGSEKVFEAGGVLCGGHSINDKDVKYGLSVTGVIDPTKVVKNVGCRVGDAILLTKPLGTGIVLSANRMGECTKNSYEQAISSMQTLNKYAAESALKYDVSAMTDVTGFGFLGHLNEMVSDDVTAYIDAAEIPYFSGCDDYAKEFFITAGGQRNRNFLERKVSFEKGAIPDEEMFALQEILFDPQTSGGLIITLNKADAQKLERTHDEFKIVGWIGEKIEKNIVVRG